MNPHLLEVIGTALIQLLIAAYVYGRLTEKVRGHDTRHAEHEKDIEKIEGEQVRQWQAIGTHGEKIAALEAGRRGGMQ